MGFVYDHDRHAAFGIQEVGAGLAQMGDQAGTTERRFVAEAEEQIAVDTGDAGRGVGQIQDQIAIRVEAGGEGRTAVDLPEPISPVTKPKLRSRTK